MTINVPDRGGGGTADPASDKHARNLQRNVPLKKSRVPLKYQGIKRVKSRGRGPEEAGHEKTGYTQKEVWNWLYLDEAGETVVGPPPSPYDVPAYGSDPPAADKAVSVQFSPTEFLTATSRLAHLDLEGFERFVGNTFDRALAGARSGRTQSSELLDASKPDSGLDVEESSLRGVPGESSLHSERDTDTYVWRDSCRYVTPLPSSTSRHVYMDLSVTFQNRILHM